MSDTPERLTAAEWFAKVRRWAASHPQVDVDLGLRPGRDDDEPEPYGFDDARYCICPDCEHVIREHGSGRLYRYCWSCADKRLDRFAEMVRRT